MVIKRWFARFATVASEGLGQYWAFMSAVSLIVVWAAVGPFVNFSSGWQLLVNTGTTVITFLMIFLVQYSQNRDTLAVQVKLDELIRSIEGARNVIMQADQMETDEIKKIRQHMDRENNEQSRSSDQRPGPAS